MHHNQMKQKFLVIGGVALVVVALGVFVLKKRKPPVQFGCVEETREVEITDPRFMVGILEGGKTYEALIGYYKCNPPQKGDIVLYQFSQTMDPVVKIVRAVEGDRFELVEDKDHGAWNLEVNGDAVTYLEGKYFFGSRNKPTLSLYEKTRNNIVGANEVILLSNVPPGMDDSGVFGMVHVNDVIGKIKMP